MGARRDARCFRGGDDVVATAQSRLSKGVLMYRRVRNRIIFRHCNVSFRNLNNADTVAAFPDLGLVFNRVKKAGNTTVLSFLWSISASSSMGGASSTRDIKKSVLTPMRASYHQAESMRNYTRVAVVRNPYDRVLSAFLNKVAPGDLYEESRKRHFKVVPGWGMESPEGFTRFVDFLGAGGLYHNRHWWPQRDLLILPPDKFDVIGKLETLPDDMARVLQLIGRDPLLARSLAKPHPLEASQPYKITGATKKRAEFYSPEVASVVRNLYASDFEAFGYPEDCF